MSILLGNFHVTPRMGVRIEIGICTLIQSIKLLGWVLLCMVVLSGCYTPTLKPVTPETSLQPASWSEVDDLFRQDQALTSWADALEASSTYYKKKSPEFEYVFGPVVVTAQEMAAACQDMARMARHADSETLRDQLKKKYQLFRSSGSDGAGEVLVTAYYEPLLKGSRTQSAIFNYPLYRQPTDMIDADLTLWFPEMKGKKLVGRIEGRHFKPYYDREAIDQDKKLAGKNLELVWVDSIIDAFFLQIQGSGRVLLTNGEILRVGYSGANGRPYRSIGKLLINEGAIAKEDMSLPALRKWLRDHPREQNRVLLANPSYVFFEKLDGGPFGNINVALTPGRSIATDYQLFPQGAPGILVTTLPKFAPDGETVLSWSANSRFIVNQDTGGAIRGPGRVDLFLGFGDDAERVAGILKSSQSRFYFIVPKIRKLKTKPKR